MPSAELRPKEVDTVLARAKAEEWIELALVAGEYAESIAHHLRRSRWPATRIFVLAAPLTQVPDALLDLTNLTSFNLGGNQIGDAGAEALARLTNLTLLDLTSNQIGDAGAKALAQLTNLTSLDLTSNQIGDAGAVALARLTNLTSLDLTSNQIGDAAAKALAQLTNLTSLYLWGNQIGDAGAEALARLTNLTSLNLYSNQIGDAGAVALARLTNLTSLDLDRNQVGDAGAEALARLTNLTSLDLKSNQVGDAGAEALARLTNLTSLDLKSNQIGAAGGRALLDAWANPATSDRARELDLRENENLEGLLPAEVLQQTDAQALIAAWRRFREAEAAGDLLPLNEAKVLVVGEEAVGKTSLVRYLVDRQPRDESEKKTPGIVIRRDVPIADWSANESPIRLHFWDFGGQEIMHQTHRYFLTRRSLYLVVLEDRREDDRSVYDWLKVIGSRGGESPILIVINKCDEGTPNLRLDETGILATHPNVVGFVAVSCNDGSEALIDGLRHRIADLVTLDPRLKHARDPFPPEQLRVKSAVAAAASEARYLARADFVRLCEKADEPELRITDRDLQYSLLQLLHDLGTVVAHGLERQRSAEAREVTLLDPNWLTEAIYALLNSKRILDQGGEFDAADMATELDEERFPPERHGYVVEMMQEPEIGLCFRLPGQGEPRWLIPECLPTVGPDVAGLFEGALRFRFTYDFLPAGLVPRFIVEAYNKFTETPTRWRTGALLAADGCKILVRADLDTNQIDLAVTGPEAQRRSALATVRHDLEEVHRLNPEIGTEARVPLPDNPELDVGYDDLLKWEGAEGPDYSFWPEKAARKYTVAELLSGVRSESARIARPQPTGVEVASHEPPLRQPLVQWSARPWFPFACGGGAVLAWVVLLAIPSNEWRAYVGGALAIGVAVTLLTMHFAPGRYYRRLLTWVIAAGLMMHAAGFAVDAGIWADAPAWLRWDGRVSGWFSLAWLGVIGLLIWAETRQVEKRPSN